MNLEDLVRAALAEEAKAEPGEDGAYERFLRHRRRGALAVAGSTGLAVALVLAVAIGGAMVAGGGGVQEGPVEITLPAPPPVPVSADGVVRRERQGFELALPRAGGSTSRRPRATPSSASRGWSSRPAGGRCRPPRTGGSPWRARRLPHRLALPLRTGRPLPGGGTVAGPGAERRGNWPAGGAQGPAGHTRSRRVRSSRR